MAAIILPGRWARQPQVPVRLNVGSELVRKVAFAWIGGQPYAITPTGAVTRSTDNTGFRTNAAGRANKCELSQVNLEWASRDFCQTSNGAGTGDFTFAVYANAAADGNLSHVLVQKNDAGGSPFTQACIFANANAFAGDAPGDVAFFTYDGNTSAVATAGGTTVDGSWSLYAGVREGTEHRLYKNGSLLASATLTARAITQSGVARYMALGSRGNGTTQGYQNEVNFAVAYDRALTAAELRALYENPWQIFAPPRRRLYFLSTGAGAVTATAAITEAPDTLASAASVSITASAQITEAADSLSAATTVAVTATASIQEAADFLSASGGTAAFATAEIVEGADAITSAASVAITATSSIVERADASTSAGTVSITASAAITERPDTILAEGGSASFATASLIEQADSLSATGTVAVGGTAAITEAADLLTSAATVSLTAIASIVEQADTLIASASVGTVTRTADAAITEAADSASSSATVAVSASAAIIEAGDIVVSGVTVLVTANAAIVEAADSISASSALVRFADAAIVEAPDYMTATVVQKIARRIAASDALAYGIAGSDSTAWRITPSDGLN